MCQLCDMLGLDDETIGDVPAKSLTEYLRFKRQLNDLAGSKPSFFADFDFESFMKDFTAQFREPEPTAASDIAGLSEAGRDVLGFIRCQNAIREPIPVTKSVAIMEAMGVTEADKLALGRIGIASARKEIDENPLAPFLKTIFGPFLDALEQAVK